MAAGVAPATSSSPRSSRPRRTTSRSRGRRSSARCWSPSHTRPIEEVAERANAGEYGLAAGVWTRDIGNAHRLASLLRAGTVYVNVWGLTDPAAPFGGFKASGVGREHGRAGLEEYLETKTVWTSLS